MSDLYFNILKTEYDLNVFVDRNILTANEGITALSGIQETVIRFLKALKYHIKKIIVNIVEFFNNKFDYDNILSNKNLRMKNYIEKKYRSFNVQDRSVFDAKFPKIKSATAFNYKNFGEYIKLFQKICSSLDSDIIKSIDADINNLASGQTYLYNKLRVFCTSFNIVINDDTKTFSLKNQDSLFPVYNNTAFDILGYNDVYSLFDITKLYESARKDYTVIEKLISRLHKFEYKLDLEIRNSMQDVTYTEGMKDKIKDMGSSIRDIISYIRNIQLFIRNIHATIVRRLNSLLIRALRLCKNLDSDTSSYESYLSETKVTITTNEDFNYRMKNLNMVKNSVIQLLDHDNIYPELKYELEEKNFETDEEIVKFCENKQSVVILPIKFYTFKQNENIITDFITDINRLLQNTNLIVSPEVFYIRSPNDSNVYFRLQVSINESLPQLGHTLNIASILLS